MDPHPNFELTKPLRKELLELCLGAVKLWEAITPDHRVIPTSFVVCSPVADFGYVLHRTINLVGAFHHNYGLCNAHGIFHGGGFIHILREIQDSLKELEDGYPAIKAYREKTAQRFASLESSLRLLG